MNTNRGGRSGLGVWVLCLSAGVLAGLVVIEVLDRATRAREVVPEVRAGDLAVGSSEYAALSLDQGGNDDILLVLDQRSESLMVYSVVNQRAVELRAREDLTELFAAARAGGGGRPAR